MTSKEINDAIKDRIARRFGLEHARFIPDWYSGPRLTDKLAEGMIEGIVEEYAGLNNSRGISWLLRYGLLKDWPDHADERWKVLPPAQQTDGSYCGFVGRHNRRRGHCHAGARHRTIKAANQCARRKAHRKNREIDSIEHR